MGRLFIQELCVERANDGLNALLCVVEPQSLIAFAGDERPATCTRMVSREVQIVPLSEASACVKETQQDDRADIEPTSAGEVQMRTSMQGVDPLHVKRPSDCRRSVCERERDPLVAVDRRNECGKVVYGDGNRCTHDAATDKTCHG